MNCLLYKIRKFVKISNMLFFNLLGSIISASRYNKIFSYCEQIIHSTWKSNDKASQIIAKNIFFMHHRKLCSTYIFRKLNIFVH